MGVSGNFDLSDASTKWKGKSLQDVYNDNGIDKIGNVGGIQDDLKKQIADLYGQVQSHDKQTDLNKQLQESADKQTAYAQSLSDQASKFRGGLSNYIGDQVNTAQDVSKRNLNEDKQKVKTDANSRGLLYSGVKSGNDASAAAYESGKLGSQIQGINKNANIQADTKDQLATQAKAGADASQIGVQQNTISQSQTAYQQALQQQQSQNNFWKDLIGGVGGLVGGVAGLL